MGIADLISNVTEEQLVDFLERFRALGPMPGILLTFLKSFIPPLPTMVIVGVNAAVYGMWLGALLSWLGLVGGCIVTFLIVRYAASVSFMERWSRKPKVQKGMRWIRRNAFSYVFVLSMFPVGPFVVVNMAAGFARMKLASFALAIGLGKAVMVLAVSYIGHDLERYVRDPVQLLYVALFLIVSIAVSKAVEARFTKPDSLS